jgi:hypothetical protein
MIRTARLTLRDEVALNELRGHLFAPGDAWARCERIADVLAGLVRGGRLSSEARALFESELVDQLPAWPEFVAQAAARCSAVRAAAAVQAAAERERRDEESARRAEVLRRAPAERSLAEGRIRAQLRPPAAPTLRVVVAYAVCLHPKADQALRNCAPQAERVDVSGSRFDYSALLVALWEDRRDFLLIEHDIEISPEILDSFAACPEPWCSVGSDPGSGTALQCNRIRRELIDAAPDAFASFAGREWDQGHDAAALAAFASAGAEVHRHREARTVHHRAQHQLLLAAARQFAGLYGQLDGETTR